MALVWHALGRQVYEYFDSIAVKWTSIDPVRFAEVGKEAGPLFLWVGVMPGTLSRDDARVAAVGCKRILAQFQITDVEIAFRESVVIRSAGPQLLNYVPCMDPTADVRNRFTPTLGLQIAAKDTPHFEGTGGLYICEGGESNRIFVLTARHVVLPPSVCRNDLYAVNSDSKPRREVILFGDKAYQNAVESIVCKIERQTSLVDYYEDELKCLEGAIESKEDARAKAQERFSGLLKEAEKEVEALNELHINVTKFWSTNSQRVLGHIVYAPPISVGTGDKSYTEDWALVELHREKIEWKSFKGNMIYLGTFRSILSGLRSFTIISRNSKVARRFCVENVSSRRDPLLPQTLTWWPPPASGRRQGRRAMPPDHG